MTDRVIRVVGVEDSLTTLRYFVPLHILPRPIAEVGMVTILNSDGRGWYKGLSVVDNHTAYAAVQAINALDLQVSGIGHFADGTSRITVIGSSTVGNRRDEVTQILRMAFGLNDCAVVEG